jgi:hypothetical protein
VPRRSRKCSTTGNKAATGRLLFGAPLLREAGFTAAEPARPRAVEGLDEEVLLSLLGIYEAALAELRRVDDPTVTGLMRRLEKRRVQAIIALANLDAQS